MKKILSLVLLMMLSLFALPMLTLSPAARADEPAEAEAAEPAGAEDTPAAETAASPVPVGAPLASESWDRAQTVTVLIDGEVRTLDLRSYLLGVLAAEIPASFPDEALKAQAVAARTYALYKQTLYAHQPPEIHRGAQLCTDVGHCSVYADPAAEAAALWGDSSDFYLQKLAAAVDDTDGLILVWEGAPIAAVFHSASVGYTENAADVWGSEIPYLVSVETPGGEDSPLHGAQTRIAQQEFADAMRALQPTCDFSGSAAHWFRASHRSQGGVIIDLTVGGASVKGSDVRQAAGLCSSNFTVRVDGDDLVFTTSGSGHGVGLSQYGARAMAQEGADFSDILLHYYTGAQLLKKTSA